MAASYTCLTCNQVTWTRFHICIASPSVILSMANCKVMSSVLRHRMKTYVFYLVEIDENTTADDPTRISGIRVADTTSMHINDSA